jgi:hypothetical protein|tara:strand:- start:853 stop:1707 length:855 start_codon:yes stop_codon:yes gene_type:complete
MSTGQNIRRSEDNFFTRFLNWGSSNPNAGASGSKTNPIQFSQITTTANKGGGMNPYLTLGMGAIGGLMGYMNKPQDIGFTGSMSNFGTAGYAPNLDLLRSIRGIGKRASSLDQMGGEFMDQYRMMIDPQSAYNEQLQANLREQVGDTTAQTVGNQNMMLAQRGMGAGGMSNILSAVAGNRANEAIRTGTLGIQQQSLAGAGQFGGMATGAVGAAGDLAATAAGLRGDIDARTLQNEQFNTQALNQYQQYIDMGRYNAAVQNQNAQGAFGNNLLNYAGGLASLFV